MKARTDITLEVEHPANALAAKALTAEGFTVARYPREYVTAEEWDRIALMEALSAWRQKIRLRYGHVRAWTAHSHRAILEGAVDV